MEVLVTPSKSMTSPLGRQNVLSIQVRAFGNYSAKFSLMSKLSLEVGFLERSPSIVMRRGITTCIKDSPPTNFRPSATKGKFPSNAGGDSSYLSMWKRAKKMEEEKRKKLEEEEKKANEERNAIAAENAARQRRERHIASMLQVPEEQREKAEKEQILNRAAAALAAVEAILQDVNSGRLDQQTKRGRPTLRGRPEWSAGKSLSLRKEMDTDTSSSAIRVGSPETTQQAAPSLPQESSDELGRDSEKDERFTSSLKSESTPKATPGPDFWSWTPPPKTESSSAPVSDLLPLLQKAPSTSPSAPLIEMDRSLPLSLSLPLQSQVSGQSLGDLSSIFLDRAAPSLPPMQSLVEMAEATVLTSSNEEASFTNDANLKENLQVPHLATQVAAMVNSSNDAAQQADSGVQPDGTRWWRESGVEHRENGEVSHWTVVRGVSADGSVEYEEKWWETSDEFDYKELGAEKSGRDATGGVWRESWREAMWQDAKNGLPHIEKTADKWARNGVGGEWHEKWWEHYDALGRAEKWADKWSKIDVNTQLEAGHAHVWHEKWGEEFDGRGAAMKYSDKWAERMEAGGIWTKWGDKWEERFDQNGVGTKGGETWWEGLAGERWNQTWGEDHNNSGWVHKYGQSSSGNHWDTNEQMETWYERRPHFGFKECLRDSWRLQQVGKKYQDKKL